MSFTNITSDYEPEFGSSAPSRDNGITHPDPVLLSSMTKAQRGAVCRTWLDLLSWMTRRFSTRTVMRMSWPRRKRLVPVALLRSKDFCSGVMR